MVDKLLQCLRLLLLAVACYGYLRCFMRCFRLAPEQGLVISFVSIGLSLFAFGCLGLLLPAAWLLIALGVALAVYSLIKREGLRPLLTAGMLFWLVLCAFSLYICYDQVFYTVDNFSHWATAVKVLLNNNAFPTASDIHIYFPKYPLGSSVLVYWFAHIANINSEWFQMLVQSVFISACLASLFSLVPKGKAKIAYPVLVLLSFAILGCNIELTSLYVDNLMPIIGLAALSLWLCRRDEVFLPLLLIACYVATVKESGIFFSAVIILLMLLDGKKPVKHALPVAAAVAAIKLLWSWHVKQVFGYSSSLSAGLSLSALFPEYASKTAEDISAIITGMVQTVLVPSVLLPLILLLALTLALARCCNSRRFALYALGGAALWLFYCVGQGAMYIFCMNSGEATHLAAFDRYFATIRIFSAGWFTLLLILELSELKLKRWQQPVAALLGIALAVVNIAPNLSHYLRTELRAPSFLADTNELMDLDWARATDKELFLAELRSEFDRLIADYKIPSGLRYMIFVGEDCSIETRLLANYLLSSQGTYVCTEAELAEKGQDYPRYDYYIVLEATDANMSFIQSQLGTSARAGYTY